MFYQLVDVQIQQVAEERFQVHFTQWYKHMGGAYSISKTF